MNMPSKKHRLIEIEYPTFGGGTPPARASVDEFRGRLALVREAIQRRNLTHLVVYGDREHFANLAYLTGFDPRFEESLLIVQSAGKPLLVVGNECSGYLNVSPLYVAGDLRHERFQTFSLLGQPRENSRLLKEIFAGEGIGKDARVGCTGWKYFAESEQPDPAHAVDLPAYMADTLRALAGWENVTNETDLFMRILLVHQRAGFGRDEGHALRLARGHDRPRLGTPLGLQRRAVGLPHDDGLRGDP
jgi:hypothetical protein